jgi:formylglycine-generating enzyme required for sulfatase activity
MVALPTPLAPASGRHPLRWPAFFVLSFAGLVSSASADGPARPIPLKLPNVDAQTQDEMKEYKEVLEHAGVNIEMVPIKGGKFLMGSSKTEEERKDDEGPQHDVEIAPFWMGKYELTWEAYDVWGEEIDILRRKFTKLQPSPRDAVADAVTRPTEPYTDMSFSMGKGKHPAICMTQHAARTYCKWLSAKTGRYYRLPTEAEWEYACRAGTTTAYSFGNDPDKLDDYAWQNSNSGGQYAKVGLKKPNPWGLYDMHGNVAEWVLDQYIPEFYAAAPQSGTVVQNPLAIPKTVYPRVVRGGGWDHEPADLRSAARMASAEEWSDQDPQNPRSIWYHTDALSVGFRVVRPLVEPSEEEKAAKWEKTEPEQKDPPE